MPLNSAPAFRRRLMPSVGPLPGLRCRGSRALQPLLGNAVKCECRNGALRRGAVKPQVQWEQHQASECFILNPDYASLHLVVPSCGFRRKDGLPREMRGRNTHDNSSVERSPCPRRRQSSTKSRRGKVTKVLHPVCQQDINAGTN